MRRFASIFFIFKGSITNLEGIDVVDVHNTAHIMEFVEKILVIGVAVTLPAKCLDLVVNALNHTR